MAPPRRRENAARRGGVDPMALDGPGGLSQSTHRPTQGSGPPSSGDRTVDAPNPPQATGYPSDRGKTPGEMVAIVSPSIPFHTIAMDFVVGLPDVPSADAPWAAPPGDFFNALLTVSDKFSKMCLLIPGHDAFTAEDWARRLCTELFRVWTGTSFSNASPNSFTTTTAISAFPSSRPASALRQQPRSGAPLTPYPFFSPAAPNPVPLSLTQAPPAVAFLVKLLPELRQKIVNIVPNLADLSRDKMVSLAQKHWDNEPRFKRSARTQVVPRDPYPKG
ncbi:hypothetical protein XA68_11755 [Ophiocordyceps unilateralis]|uniref:Uncharacterized protein n=1 Tax=Ophiocordyceps unilateralis TaxID=268505 RepID=A0A2A9PG40_OPHUN|nr:hypothetical protein XA68_11755 [Ophiocordyceps unilateralis]